MEVISNITHSYKAIDGEIFATKAQCIAYEEKLPRHLRFCLERKYTSEELKSETIHYFEVIKIFRTSRTEYESPAFLREGGEYTVYEDHERIVDRYKATLNALIWEIVKDDDFWSHRSSHHIRTVHFKELKE